MKKENGFSKIWIILIVTSVIVIAGVVIIILNQNHSTHENNQNSNDNIINNTENTAKVQIPEEKYAKINRDKQIYINKNGEVIDFSSTISGITKDTDFTYGTGIIKKDNQYAIVDSTGKIVVDYGTYSKIDDNKGVYVAKKPNKKYILVSKDGKVVTEKEYNSITTARTKLSNIYENYIFIAKSDDKSSVITATGSIIYESKEDNLRDLIKLWNFTASDFCTVVINDNVFIMDKEQYQVRYSFKSKNVGISADYVTDIDQKVTYLFDDKANMQLKLTDCLIEEDKSWEENHVYYGGCKIENYSKDYGYIIYRTADKQSKIVYKDGTVIANLSEDLFKSLLYSPYLINKNSVWIEDGNNIVVYEKNKKLKVIENRRIPLDYIISQMTMDSNIIPLLSAENKNFYLYNEKGEKFNNVTYESIDNSLLKSVHNNTWIKPLFNGVLMDAKEYLDIKVIAKKDKKNSYSENYFIGVVSKPNEKNCDYYLIDKEGNKILDIKTYAESVMQLDEEEGIFIFLNEKGKTVIFDLKQNKIILEAKLDYKYLKEYRAILLVAYPRDVYSLAERKLYNYSGYNY